jgi:small subunit ribosomal protein S13
MPRILNVQIPDKKRVVIGLSYIKGIGRSRSNLICNRLNIDESTYMSELSKTQISNITNYIQKHYKTGPKIDNDRILNIRALIKISSYRGLRHFKGLPVRGQRTKTNAKTVRKIDRKL